MVWKLVLSAAEPASKNGKENITSPGDVPSKSIAERTTKGQRADTSLVDGTPAGTWSLLKIEGTTTSISLKTTIFRRCARDQRKRKLRARGSGNHPQKFRRSKLRFTFIAGKNQRTAATSSYERSRIATG